MQQQELFKKIYRTDITGADRIKLLHQSVEAYPFFGLSYFFLLKELEKGSDHFNEIVPKTALHFKNNYWLNLQLNQDDAKRILNDEQPVEKKEKAPKEDFLFEPLYTTDYFASQGIKFSEEQQPTDKLGNQVKSFTQWLKTMKKVHGNTLPETNAPIDNAVEKLAEKSNTETAVITETMAEVFVQQGKIDKAIDVYKKLSLQNPAKSAYFADKIEYLK